MIVAAGVLGLSYFNTYGLVGESSYQGLAIDNNGIFLALLFVFHNLVSTSVCLLPRYSTSSYWHWPF